MVTTSETGITSTTSDNLDDSASPGPSNSCVITSSERKLKLSKDTVSLGTTADECTAALTEETNDEDDDEEEEEEIVQKETEAKAGNYVIMDTGILFSLLNDLVKCPRCGFSVETNSILQEKQRLAQLIKISCCSISCRWEKSFYTSETVKNSGWGATPFDINLRAIMAFREIGKCHAAMNTLCGHMNMPPPMAEITFNETVKSRLHPKYIDVVNRNMKDAAEEVRRKLADEYETEVSVYDTAASCDGSWQRRGYSSINGIVTAIHIDTGKCLAFGALVKNCKACEMWASRKGTIEYGNFVKDHNCPINHHGSAGAMESVCICCEFVTVFHNVCW